MPIPKSKKLQEEEATREVQQPKSSIISSALPKQEGPIQIRPVKCCNDFVAILQAQIETSLAMVDNESTYKNEGVVVGVGPGIADGNGGRLKPSVEIGEVVMFGPRNIVATVESSTPPYEGQKVVIVSERNILCKLSRQVEYELLEE